MTDENRSPAHTFFASGRARWFVAAALSAAVLVVVIATVALSSPPGRLTGSPADPSSSSRPSGSPEPSPSASSDATPAPTPPGESFSPDGRTVAPVVPLTSSAEVSPGVVASVTKLEAVDGEARAPGDVAAPSVRVTLVITNGTGSMLDLATARTNLYFGADANPASELPGPGSSPLPGSVAAGESASTTLVFSVPIDQRDDVNIQFDYSVDVPIVAFRGAAPR